MGMKKKKSYEQLPTIRTVESTKLENIRTSRKQMKEWAMTQYPSRSAPIKSVTKLRTAISDFFETYPIDIHNTTIEDFPTQYDLALYLGYPSLDALNYDIYRSSKDPEYKYELAKAIDMIENAILKRQMRIAQDSGKWDGIDSALSRIERKTDRARPKEDDKIRVEIEMNNRATQVARSILDEQLGLLFEDVMPIEEAVIKALPAYEEES